MDDFRYASSPGEQTEDSILIGQGASILKVPADHWKSHLASATERIGSRLAFMSDQHHLIRRFAVKEIARTARPLSEAEICRALKLTRDRVHQILGDLERRLFFLVRNSKGAVSWAYPFTTGQTPHTLIRQSRRPAHAA
jgi:hypothetical protein